jgi:uncharacterized phage protein (TIGR02218 family)
MTSISEGQLTSLAFCWRLERSDGAGLGLTSSDRELEKDGVLYRSDPGVTPASISRSTGLEPDSGEVAGALSADSLSDRDLMLGRWNGASVTLFAADWTARDAEPVQLLAGELGEVSINDDSFSAELRGAAARLGRAPCPSTSPECRASFGDRSCRVDLAGRMTRSRISSADGAVLQLEDAVDDRFVLGRARYLSGANCGLSSIILSVNGTEIVLRDRPRVPIEAGSVIQLRQGCDKRFETCISRFNNGVNFRGEPHLPGTDLLTRYPGA